MQSKWWVEFFSVLFFGQFSLHWSLARTRLEWLFSLCFFFFLFHCYFTLTGVTMVHYSLHKAVCRFPDVFSILFFSCFACLYTSGWSASEAKRIKSTQTHALCCVIIANPSNERKKTFSWKKKTSRWSEEERNKETTYALTTRRIHLFIEMN